MEEKTYPKVETILNKPVFLRLRFDSPKEMDNSEHPDWGKSYLWGVDEYDSSSKTWIPKSWFASAKAKETILDLGIKTGGQFQIVKRSDENPKTKKIYTYFDVIYKGAIHDTRKTELPLDAPEEIPPEGFEEESPTGVKISPSSPEISSNNFEDVATEVWNTVMDWICRGIDIDSELTPVQQHLIDLRIKIIETCPSMVNTQCIQNGGKK